MNKALKVILALLGFLFLIVGALSAFDAFEVNDIAVILGKLVVPVISILIGLLLVRVGLK